MLSATTDNLNKGGTNHSLESNILLSLRHIIVKYPWIIKFWFRLSALNKTQAAICDGVHPYTIYIHVQFSNIWSQPSSQYIIYTIITKLFLKCKNIL